MKYSTIQAYVFSLGFLLSACSGEQASPDENPVYKLRRIEGIVVAANADDPASVDVVETLPVEVSEPIQGVSVIFRSAHGERSAVTNERGFFSLEPMEYAVRGDTNFSEVTHDDYCGIRQNAMSYGLDEKSEGDLVYYHFKLPPVPKPPVKQAEVAQEQITGD